MSWVIELRDVVKRYPGGVEALGGVTLTLAATELVAIVGPSGSGKSTLLHVMGTLERPTSGVVSVAGHDVAGLPDRRLAALRSRFVGFVFQQYHLLEGMSALDNVATGLLYRGVAARARRRRAAESLARVGLAERIHHQPARLSGGERQRVAIARALVSEPAVVLADEPTGNLDSRSGGEVVALLQRLNREGTTIAVITHDPNVALALPRRIEILDGRIERDSGAPEEEGVAAWGFR
ncbi:ABC transporter ATP-binding protein [soil metagenome]